MSQPSKSNRIWELDALRGICILFVVFFHFLYDLQALTGFRISDYPAIFWIMQYGGILFVLLSGLCATLGRRSFRRGLLVFACGTLIQTSESTAALCSIPVATTGGSVVSRGTA